MHHHHHEDNLPIMWTRCPFGSSQAHPGRWLWFWGRTWNIEKNHCYQKAALIPVLLGLLQTVAKVWQSLDFSSQICSRISWSVSRLVGGDHAKEAIISDGGQPSVQRCNVSNASLKFNCKPVTMIPTLSFWDNQTLKLIVYPHNKLWLGTAAFAILALLHILRKNAQY